MVFNGFLSWKIHEYLPSTISVNLWLQPEFSSVERRLTMVFVREIKFRHLGLKANLFSVLCGGGHQTETSCGKISPIETKLSGERRVIQLQFQITPIIVNAAAQSCSLQLAWFLPIVAFQTFSPPSQCIWFEGGFVLQLFVLISAKDQHQQRTEPLIRTWVAPVCDGLTWISSGWVFSICCGVHTIMKGGIPGEMSV